MKGYWLGLVLSLAVFLPALARAEVASPLCIAPAQPEGGFDVTCRLLAEALDRAEVFQDPLSRIYLPGGVGAVAFDAMTDTRASEDGTIVAFSEGSIYNLVLGRYGDHDLSDVRWLAQIAQDHGAVVVREDADWPDLAALMADVRALPQRVAFGGGGSIAGQDWMRAAMTVEMAGVDHRKMRFVAFEGAGSCTQALVEGFVQACMNDVADTLAAIQAGKPLRILAVFAPERLAGLADVPTAREQGIALNWPVMRGVYMGPDVSDEAFGWWQKTLAGITASPDYADLLAQYHLSPDVLIGPDLDAAIADLAHTARERSDRLGIP